jgi:hypothetical protein
MTRQYNNSLFPGRSDKHFSFSVYQERRKLAIFIWNCDLRTEESWYVYGIVDSRGDIWKQKKSRQLLAVTRVKTIFWSDTFADFQLTVEVKVSSPLWDLWPNVTFCPKVVFWNLHLRYRCFTVQQFIYIYIYIYIYKASFSPVWVQQIMFY